MTKRSQEIESGFTGGGVGSKREREGESHVRRGLMVWYVGVESEVETILRREKQQHNTTKGT